ncbi:MAG: MarR family transcriptional regulator [Acutalibacteraceae bacterium]|nr:MarR family transcriptional regulator [Acutalibacteraceae bacterium]
MKEMHPRHIGFELRQVANIIRREIDNAVGKRNIEKLTGMQGRLIGYLCHNGEKEIFQRDIEAEFSIRRSTATNILQTMEKHGLIKRAPVEYDARLKRILPTDIAVTRHKIFEEEINRVENQVLNGITKKEADTLLSILDKIKKNLGE